MAVTKKTEIINVLEDMGIHKPLYIAGWDLNWYSYNGKLKIEWHVTQLYQSRMCVLKEFYLHGYCCIILNIQKIELV